MGEILRSTERCPVGLRITGDKAGERDGTGEREGENGEEKEKAGRGGGERERERESFIRIET